MLAAVGALSAQTRPADGLADFFPEAAEIDSTSRAFSAGFEDAAGLAKVKDGKLISDVGFIRYERADYSGTTPLSIEVFTLLDSYAAYSLVTLLRENHIRTGPPGDVFTIGDESLLFVHGRIFVRISGKGTPGELLEKTAEAVSSKTAASSGELPRLAEYFPSAGYDADTLRYFPSAAVYKTWAGVKTPEYIRADYDMEIAVARYFTGNHSGTVSIMKFPTPELAEAYQDDIALSMTEVPFGISIYTRSVGPLVAILEGDFDHVSASRLLSALKFSYSMHWVYGEENAAAVIWGVPGVVLTAVAASLIFSAIAISASVLFGLALGGGRYAFRRYKEKSFPQLFADDSGITRLNLWKS